MIKILQKKFVITAMVAVSVLIIFLLGTINTVNYWLVGRQTDRTIDMLSRNEGEFSPRTGPQQKGMPDFLNPPMNEDRAMSARFFMVRMDADDNIVQIDVTQISSVSEAEAEAYAKEVGEKKSSLGSIGYFKYSITESRDERGSVLVFLDTSSQFYSILLVLAISISIGGLCWFLMLLLVIGLSRKAIFPIARNIEKQKQFVTNAGHEIKTPLAIILANTDALELHNGESKWSRNIRSQTVRLGGLMQNLLTLAKMEEGGSRLTASDFSLSRLLEETLYPFYEPTALNGICIQKDIQPDVMLYANRENIMQLISILLDNAAKYTNPGGDIAVSLKKQEKDIQFQVKNSCLNLPEQEPGKLFERFYRGDAARTQKNGGYGIGLSVAGAIAEANRGSIWAEYENGNSVVFTVRLGFNTQSPVL